MMDSMNRRQHQLRKTRRRRAIQRWVIRLFIGFEVVVGGLSGVLLAAIILGEGHPMHDAIRDWLVQVLRIS